MSNFTLKYLLPLLLITVLCFVGVKAFYRQVEQRMAGVETEPKQSSDPPVAALNPAAATDGQANVDASVITRRNLFASKEDARLPPKMFIFQLVNFFGYIFRSIIGI